MVSMKMELVITASRCGVVQRVVVEPGQQVERGMRLLELAPEVIPGSDDWAGHARLPVQWRIGVHPRPFLNNPLRTFANLPHHLRRRADVLHLSGALAHID